MYYYRFISRERFLNVPERVDTTLNLKENCYGWKYSTVNSWYSKKYKTTSFDGNSMNNCTSIFEETFKDWEEFNSVNIPNH